MCSAWVRRDEQLARTHPPGGSDGGREALRIQRDRVLLRRCVLRHGLPIPRLLGVQEASPVPSLPSSPSHVSASPRAVGVTLPTALCAAQLRCWLEGQPPQQQEGGEVYLGVVRPEEHMGSTTLPPAPPVAPTTRGRTRGGLRNGSVGRCVRGRVGRRAGKRVVRDVARRRSGRRWADGAAVDASVDIGWGCGGASRRYYGARAACPDIDEPDPEARYRLRALQTKLSAMGAICRRVCPTDVTDVAPPRRLLPHRDPAHPAHPAHPCLPACLPVSHGDWPLCTGLKVQAQRGPAVIMGGTSRVGRVGRVGRVVRI